MVIFFFFSLILINNREFVQKFALAIISNGGSQLTNLDISDNPLDDKGDVLLW